MTRYGRLSYLERQFSQTCSKGESTLLTMWFELGADGRPTLMGQYPDGFTHWQAKFDSWEMAKRMFPNVETRIKI